MSACHHPVRVPYRIKLEPPRKWVGPPPVEVGMLCLRCRLYVPIK